MNTTDRCQTCRQEDTQEWVPPVSLGGKTLAGTGVWQSALTEGRCTRCLQAIEDDLKRASRVGLLREQFIRLLGGSRPCREFTFERYQITSGNQAAIQQARQFDPAKDNLYFWGRCGVGKTHLAVAILRRWFGRGMSVDIVTPFQLIRKLRMKPPDEEQQVIDGLIRVQVLLLDDFGGGSDTAFARQAVQEILDGRHFRDRGGLVVTSQHSPDLVAQRSNDRAIPSRLAGMCQVTEIKGVDRRIQGAGST